MLAPSPATCWLSRSRAQRSAVAAAEVVGTAVAAAEVVGAAVAAAEVVGSRSRGSRSRGHRSRSSRSRDVLCLPWVHDEDDEL